MVDLSDIFKPQCMGVVPGKDCPAIVVLFHLPHHAAGYTFKLKPSLQTKLKAADACKQAADAHHWSLTGMRVRGSTSPLMTR